MKVADTILEQLGGNQFLAMTGSHGLVAGDNALHMRLRKNTINATHLVIKLNAMDTYDVSFLRIHGDKRTVKKSYENVYNDQLRSIFEEATGMCTSL